MTTSFDNPNCGQYKSLYFSYMLCITSRRTLRKFEGCRGGALFSSSTARTHKASPSHRKDTVNVNGGWNQGGPTRGGNFDDECTELTIMSPKQRQQFLQYTVLRKDKLEWTPISQSSLPGPGIVRHPLLDNVINHALCLLVDEGLEVSALLEVHG